MSRRSKVLAAIAVLLSGGLTAAALAGEPAARVGDFVFSPFPMGLLGTVQTGDPTVLINGFPAAGVGDRVTCALSNPPVFLFESIITSGNPTVLISGRAAG